MRVGTGIILSVLSSSVFAAVIPNYDSHGLLLVRRAVNTDTRFVLVNKNNEKQAGLGPSSSGAGDGASTETSNDKNNPNYSSIDSGSSKLDRFLAFLKRLYRSFKISLNTPRQKYIQWRDKKLIKAAIKKVAGVVQGENKKEFLSEIDKFLTSVLGSARMASGLFDNSVKTPLFLLSIPKDKNQKSLTKEMTEIHKFAKTIVKDSLKGMTSSIANITKFPQHMVNELSQVADKFARISTMLRDLEDENYKPLVSKVRDTNNEKYIQATEAYVSSLKGYQDSAWKTFKSIQKEITSGRITLKGYTPAKPSASELDVQNSPWLKSKSSTGVTPNQEVAKQEISKHEISGQEESGEDDSYPIPAKRRRKMFRLETYV
ncbi:hypothetical protein BASA61_004410 [Batrachochytrium salamandrivorans]|nr:hypothetical protein BASA60_011382 [Batrachochytrium salamandrivorans]KAH6592861.1 hypothetical protein BASA61_004410 [Batrachochytrium salamandrivorans]KAH9275378.1 hypothetical protein BASA83_002151 [Batrachochytrium salamandrivorans]